MKHRLLQATPASPQRGDIVGDRVFDGRRWLPVAADPDVSLKGGKGDPGESIKGDQGDKGDPGESIKGDKGDPGPRGKRGPVGKEGATYYQNMRRTITENASKMTIGFSESVALGDVVRVSGESIASKAIASGSDPAAMAIGLVSAAGEIQTSGPFTNPAWSLTPGTVYYLSPDLPAGGITSARPDSLGQYIVIVGFASATTTLVISIHHAIKLET